MGNNATKKTCQVEMYHQKTCGREIWDEEEGTCVLHSSNVEQKEEPFFRELNNYMGQVESNKEIEYYDFSKIVFCAISFSLQVFSKPAHFIFARFQNKANFSGAKFENEVAFSGARFKNEALFSMANFLYEATFYGAEFQNKADFSAAKFQNKAFFSRARFQNEAKFLAVQFQDIAGFKNALFKDQADFQGAKFHGTVDFSLSEFRNIAFFIGTEFQDEANFLAGEFQDIVLFSKAKFQKEVLFYLSKFLSHADFREAQFNREAHFSGARFLKLAKFGSSRVSNKLQFANSILNLADFRHMVLEREAKVLFFGVDLGKSTFLNTDLTNFDFTNVIWAKARRWHYSRKVLFDETLSGDSSDPEMVKTRKELDYQASFESVENLYRQLKKKYEDIRDYSTGGDFHIGEMEMKRLSPEGNILPTFMHRHFSLIALYKYASYYGENYILPLLWLALGIGLFSLFFMFSGLSPAPDTSYHSFNYDLKLFSFPSFSQLFDDFTSSLIYTLRIFSFQREGLFQPQNKWGHFWAILARVYSPAMIALFLLALRRRFKR